VDGDRDDWISFYQTILPLMREQDACPHWMKRTPPGPPAFCVAITRSDLPIDEDPDDHLVEDVIRMCRSYNASVLGLGRIFWSPRTHAHLPDAVRAQALFVFWALRKAQPILPKDVVLLIVADAVSTGPADAVRCSAKTGQGILSLLDMTVALADWKAGHSDEPPPQQPAAQEPTARRKCIVS
jgi:hypothetical protein